MAANDPYDVLGVPEDATTEEIKAVYRQLARAFHPDVNPAPGAVEHFRAITEAYLLLCDPERRTACDRNRRPRRRARDGEEETETYLGLRLAGIDLGGVLGVSVTVRRRTLFPDGPDDDPPAPPSLRSRRS